jgi:hypothetical protein
VNDTVDVAGMDVNGEVEVAVGWIVVVLPDKGGDVVPLGEGETVSYVPVTSGGVPGINVAGEANGV